MIKAWRRKEWSVNRSPCRMMVLTAFLALAGCQQTDPAPEPSTTPKVADETSSTTSAAVKALSAVGRAEILAAVAAAADEVAAGNPLPQANLELTNRSFELTMPIACEDGATGTWGSWRFDPSSRVLRVTFSRQNWAAEPLFTELANGQTFETAEGFWIERPWTRSEQCPQTTNRTSPPGTPDKAGEAKDEAVAPLGPVLNHRLALVQYFSSDTPRTQLRGKRPYGYSAKLPEYAGNTARSFRVRIEGRIAAFGDGQPVHCVNRQTSQPPICALAVEFGKITLEDAASGETLVDWDS